MKQKKLMLQHEDGTLEELSTIVIGDALQNIIPVEIKYAVQKYVELCTSLKCIKNQNNEKLGFVWFIIFLSKRKVDYVHQIKREHIDLFEIELLKRMKPSSVNRRFNTYKNFFTKCLEWEYIYKNPCLGKKKIKSVSKRRSPWTEFIFNEFVHKCSGIYYSVFMFLWFTGCRPMEMKNLKWTDVDYENKTLTFSCGKNKDITRPFPLTPVIDQILHNIKPESIYVFSENKKQINNDTLYHYCKNRLNELHQKSYSVYGIRHGFGTRLARQGVNSFYIA